MNDCTRTLALHSLSEFHWYACQIEIKCGKEQEQEEEEDDEVDEERKSEMKWFLIRHSIVDCCMHTICAGSAFY